MRRVRQYPHGQPARCHACGRGRDGADHGAHQREADKLEFYRAQAQHLKPRNDATYWRSDAPNAIARDGAWWPPVYLGDDIGYNGDPGSATVATGDRLVAAATEKLSAFFADFADAALRSGGMPA